MDIDALKTARTSSWSRLHELARSSSLTGPEIDELARLYRAGTADLAAIRSATPDPDLIRVLSRDLAAARARLTGTSGTSAYSIARWFRAELPAALYSIRWWSITVMILFIVVAAVHAAWIFADPLRFSALGTPIELERYAKSDFVQYYHQDTNAEFGASVWVNNAFIALQCVGAGITGIYPAYVMFNNAAAIGQAAAIVIQFGGVWHFFRFILPHGLPELTAIFIAGAAGLRVFWAALVPGGKPRMQSVAQAGRAMVTVSLGLVILLFISGILEGYVTPSDLPDWVRVGLGSLVTAGVWAYTFIVGGRATRAGYSGDLTEDAGYSTPVAG